MNSVGSAFSSLAMAGRVTHSPHEELVRVLLAPAPEHFPGGHELLNYARGGQFQKADAVGDLFVLVFHGERA